MEKKSKLLKVEKLIIRGEHYTKEDQKYGEKYWYFVLTFENGDTGNARAKSPDKVYGVDNQHSYVVNTFKDRNGVERMSFTKVTDLSAKWSGGGSKKKDNDPTITEQIINQVTLACAIKLYPVVKDTKLMEIKLSLDEWVKTKVFNDKLDSQMICGVMKIATEYCILLHRIQEGEKIELGVVNDNAEQFYEEVIRTDWNQSKADEPFLGGL